jgi:hypothetical protein
MPTNAHDQERKLYTSMVLRDTMESAGKGGALGGLVGAASRAAGGKLGPGYRALLGTAAGAAIGGAKSRERVLKDVVKEQRTDDRHLRRLVLRESMKKHSHAAFADELLRLLSQGC